MKKLLLLFAVLLTTVGAWAQVQTLASNGSVVVNFTPETWQDPISIPEAVSDVEKAKWPENTSKIMTADVAEFNASAGYIVPELIYEGGNKRLEIIGVELLDTEENVIPMTITLVILAGQERIIFIN